MIVASPPSNTSSGGDYAQRSFAPCVSTTSDMMRTNALADRNTIVNMGLRLGRFVLCVTLALVFAFGFALLTSNKKTLTYVYEHKVPSNETLSTKAALVVENYNTLFGYLLFAGGKIFEVFCETLIFPTLATYLHNCCLYPGDQPARMHSVTKARCIFWGLKTVIILMNVGFTSVYVGQTTLNSAPSSRRLDELAGLSMQTNPSFALDANAELPLSILRTSATGVTVPFVYEDTCRQAGQSNENASLQWETWADDVDTTSVSFSFPSHAWNAALLSSNTLVPTKTADISMRDYLANKEKYGITDGWGTAELYSIFQQSLQKLGLLGGMGDTPMPRSLGELVRMISDELTVLLPARAQLSDLILRLEYRKIAGDVELTTLLLSVPLEADRNGEVLCGASGCVFVTSSSVLKELRLQPRVSIASYKDDVDSALICGTSNQYVLDLESAEHTPREVLTLSLSKLAWKLSPLHIRHNAACARDDEYMCLGLSVPFATGDNVLLVGKEMLSMQHAVRLHPLVTLYPATIPDIRRHDVLTSWYCLVSPDGILMRPSTSECISVVDAYLVHRKRNHFNIDGRQTQDMFAAALFYLLQRGVPMSYADVMSRRRLASSVAMTSNSSAFGNSITTAATTDIEVNVPTATAMVTLAGCIFIVLLMMSVIYLPTPRVKLSPDTTPAAQYVQILTDDLYPDLVHKKRLRFANGDCLLFNEYVVDAIVLNAKRDHTKKIYL
uniref:Transmembrane protein n=1 Tax=Hyaloperonospora arabidopsidis (strain Emoy2) TaxID=559515 RepID=M4BGA3_HYAAE